MTGRGRTRSSEQEQAWVDERDALAIHGRVLAIHGGAAGVRDQGLLESALARPRQHYAYASAASTLDLAAIYMAGIVQNHPFFDGNKRTGFVIGILFLELNGFEFHASEEDAAQAIMSLAAGTLDEAALANWMKANVKRKRS